MNESRVKGICVITMAKCFDTIDHDLLLLTLTVCANSAEFGLSYLRQRQEAVLCKGKLSSFVDISSGVPQGLS